jgi:hypothetical protein
LLLAACYPAATPPPPQALDLPRQARPGQGIDLANDTSNVLNELSGSRVDFVARYYREPDSRWPPLSASEAQRLSSQGLKIVAVWESHSRTPAHFSYVYGYHDATSADRQARTIGQPAGSAIYFAVDYNVPSQSLPAIDDYFRGVTAGLAAAGGGRADYTVGVYGSGAVCDAVKGAGLARYTWLSNALAWNGAGYQDWNIMQMGRSAELSFDHDADEARDDYGGFQVAGDAGLGSLGGYRSGVFAAPQFPPPRQSITSAIVP